ncbi:hypothetical protein [Nostoc sp.]|uniref:hypothetical protein n=1 Tax=Nostoc sp. TaxID=1180 RepID=UPI002FF5ED6D
MSFVISHWSFVWDFQEINYPSCGVGRKARPEYRTGEDTHPTRKFGMFFYLSVPHSPPMPHAQCPMPNAPCPLPTPHSPLPIFKD